MKDYYQNNNLKAWDVIDLCLSYLEGKMDNKESFCIGNVLKYLFRYKSKGFPVSDIDKAIDYLNRLKSYIQDKESDG